MQKPIKPLENQSFLELRAVGIALNAVLFASNFLLFYFIFSHVFQDIIGFVRLTLCWVGAYAMTWVMASQTKGVARLILVLVFLCLLFIIFRYQPSP